MNAVMAAQNPHLPRAEVLVDTDALRHNIALLSGLAAASGAQTMAVVKADGYGHGALHVARTALASGASWVGVCHLDEALALRAGGITAPIFSWLHVPDEHFDEAVSAGIDLSVSSLVALDAVLASVNNTGTSARIHLKADTGLSRNGCAPQDWPELVKAAAAAQRTGWVEVIGVWSHLACADEPGHPSIDAQAKRLNEAHALAVDAGLRPIRHIANSAAVLSRPDLHFELVRTGIAMYGLNPMPPGFGGEQLRPAMTFRARVALTKRIAAGEGVSYGLSWTAPRETTIALVPAGYADGVPRALSGRMEVLLGGKRRQVVGRVCMDQVMVDCGDDAVREGDEVVLFGPGTRGEPTATEWADTLGTIHYEIVTGMTRPRVVRTVVPVGGA